jgi:hypothetical protein
MVAEVNILSFFFSFLGATLYCNTTYNGQPIDIVSVFFTIPAVLVSSVAALWWTGDIAAWWKYEEVCVS